MNTRILSENSPPRATTKSIQELLDKHLPEIKARTDPDIEYVMGMNYRTRTSGAIFYTIRFLTNKRHQIEVEIEKEDTCYESPSRVNRVTFCH